MSFNDSDIPRNFLVPDRNTFIQMGDVWWTTSITVSLTSAAAVAVYITVTHCFHPRTWLQHTPSGSFGPSAIHKRTDGLIQFSDTTEGLQKQLNGLYKYCSNNHMIVNETKTKVMCLGWSTEIRVNYNGVPVQQVDQYKYLGNIMKFVSKQNQDVSASNYDYLCNQSLRAIYSFRKKDQENWCITS